MSLRPVRDPGRGGRLAVIALVAIMASGLAIAASLRRTGPDEIEVYAAVSLTEALTEAGASFEAATGTRVRFNFGASSLLARQIEEGAPADVFISADSEKMDSLERSGRLVPGSRRDLLSNTLVVVVRSDFPGAPEGPADLLGPEIRHVAVAEPSSVPAGIYARLYLSSLGLWEKLAGRIVPTENVRAALAAVESGNVEAGIVYRTDASVSRRVRIAFEVPPGEGPRIVYPVAAVRSHRMAGRASAFLEYLESAEVLQLFQHHGFGKP